MKILFEIEGVANSNARVVRQSKTISFLNSVIESTNFDSRSLKLNGTFADMTPVEAFTAMAFKVALEKDQKVSNLRNDKFNF